MSLEFIHLEYFNYWNALLLLLMNISGKFEALGKRFSSFYRRSFKWSIIRKHKKALDVGLTDSMNDAFNKAIDEALQLQ